MSDKELLRLIDSRSEQLVDDIRSRRNRHLDLMTQAYDLEAEMVALSNLLSALQKAASSVRSGGKQRDEPAGEGDSGDG